MGQIGQTLGGLVGIGQNPGLDTYGASPYGQNYANLLQQQQANLQSVNQSQTALAGQLGQVAQGNGPNPAQAMLNQQTGKNVATQGALQAGQRGASQNVGLVARNAGQQGANIQQQAAGQGATMQAQQQLGAMGQQAGVLGQQGQQAVQGMGAYEAAINSANQINAQTAANQAQFGQGFGGGLLTGFGSMLAEGGEVKMAGGGDPFSFGSNGGDYATPMPQSQGDGGGGSFIGNFLSGATGGGGQTSKRSAGGHGIISGFAKSFKGMSKSGANDPMAGSQSLGSGSTYNQNLTAFGNSQSPGLGMPGGSATSGWGTATGAGQAAGNAGWAGADTGAGAGAADIGASDAGASGLADVLVAQGGKINMGSKLKKGGPVPGQAKVKGNSYDNDHVKALLSPGEIVIPRSVTQGKDPIRGAAQFVQAVMNKKGKRA